MALLPVRVGEQAPVAPPDRFLDLHARPHPQRLRVRRRTLLLKSNQEDLLQMALFKIQTEAFAGTAPGKAGNDIWRSCAHTGGG